jgi:hypothetical protein
MIYIAKRVTKYHQQALYILRIKHISRPTKFFPKFHSQAADEPLGIKTSIIFEVCKNEGFDIECHRGCRLFFLASRPPNRLKAILQ